MFSAFPFSSRHRAHTDMESPQYASGIDTMQGRICFQHRIGLSDVASGRSRALRGSRSSFSLMNAKRKVFGKCQGGYKPQTPTEGLHATRLFCVLAHFGAQTILNLSCALDVYLTLFDTISLTLARNYFPICRTIYVRFSPKTFRRDFMSENELIKDV